MVKTFCPFAGDRARRAERPVLTLGRALAVDRTPRSHKLYKRPTPPRQGKSRLYKCAHSHTFSETEAQRAQSISMKNA
jgi:hypothetical protein